MKIRLTQKEDLPSLVILLEELFSIEQDFSPCREKQEQGLLLLLESPSAFVFVGTIEGEVIAMASLQTLISTVQGTKVGIIEDVIVASKYRSKGYGRKLLEHIETFAKSIKLSRLQLLADKDNHGAIDFYKGFQWNPTSLIAFMKTIL